jgi:hypothetical protein
MRETPQCVDGLPGLSMRSLHRPGRRRTPAADETLEQLPEVGEGTDGGLDGASAHDPPGDLNPRPADHETRAADEPALCLSARRARRF